MFMFMTTCWMHETPPAQTASQQDKVAPTSGAADLPASRFQGVLQQIPVQLSMNRVGAGSETVSYEAVITLNPIVQPARPMAPLAPGVPTRPSVSFAQQRSRESQQRQKVAKSRSQSDTLENMRRSLYFSADLFEPLSRERYHSREDNEEPKMQEENLERRKSSTKANREYEAPSRDDAKKDVGDIVSRVGIQITILCKNGLTSYLSGSQIRAITRTKMRTPSHLQLHLQARLRFLLQFLYTGLHQRARCFLPSY